MSYQAIYDATRSRIGNFDSSSLVDSISRQFDISWQVEQVKSEFLSVAYEMQRPSTIYKPTLSIDGNQWIALYGENLQDGVAGCGDSPAKAFTDFDKEWLKNLERTIRPYNTPHNQTRTQ